MKPSYSQLVVTVLEDDRVEWDKQYKRLRSQAKRRGKTLRQNDISKFCFLLGMKVVRDLNYQDLVTEIRMLEKERRKPK